MQGECWRKVVSIVGGVQLCTTFSRAGHINGKRVCQAVHGFLYRVHH